MVEASTTLISIKGIHVEACNMFLTHNLYRAIQYSLVSAGTSQKWPSHVFASPAWIYMVFACTLILQSLVLICKFGVKHCVLENQSSYTNFMHKWKANSIFHYFGLDFFFCSVKLDLVLAPAICAQAMFHITIIDGIFVSIFMHQYQCYGCIALDINWPGLGC